MSADGLCQISLTTINADLAYVPEKSDIAKHTYVYVCVCIYMCGETERCYFLGGNVTKCSIKLAVNRDLIVLLILWGSFGSSLAWLRKRSQILKTLLLLLLLLFSSLSLYVPASVSHHTSAWSDVIDEWPFPLPAIPFADLAKS